MICSLVTSLSLSIANILPRRSEGDNHIEKSRVLLVSLEPLRSINQGFLSHSGCS